MIWPWRRRDLTVQLLDRHAEHVDPGVPPCIHEKFVLYAGDSMGVVDGTGRLSIELQLTSRRHLDVIVNTIEYHEAKESSAGRDG